jgi:hypothetical protein
MASDSRALRYYADYAPDTELVAPELGADLRPTCGGFYSLHRDDELWIPSCEYEPCRAFVSSAPRPMYPLRLPANLFVVSRLRPLV